MNCIQTLQCAFSDPYSQLGIALFIGGMMVLSGIMMPVGYAIFKVVRADMRAKRQHSKA